MIHIFCFSPFYVIKIHIPFIFNPYLSRILLLFQVEKNSIMKEQTELSFPVFQPLQAQGSNIIAPENFVHPYRKQIACGIVLFILILALEFWTLKHPLLSKMMDGYAVHGIKALSLEIIRNPSQFSHQE